MIAVVLLLVSGVFAADNLQAPGIVASFCDATSTSTATYTAPDGFLIDRSNYLVVSGCNATGQVNADGTNITAHTDCSSGKTSAVLLGVDVKKVTITGSGTCGDARLTADQNDQGTYGSSKCGQKNPVGSINLVRVIPNAIGSCCQAPSSECGTGTATALPGYLIDGSRNYFVVTGCAASGSVDGTKLKATTDCITGRMTPQLVGQNYASLTVHGGGYCGEARITRDKNDIGVYGSNNPGIILVPTAPTLLEKKVHYQPAQFLGKSEGQKNVARLKARLAAQHA